MKTQYIQYKMYVLIFIGMKSILNTHLYFYISICIHSIEKEETWKWNLKQKYDIRIRLRIMRACLLDPDPASKSRS